MGQDNDVPRRINRVEGAAGEVMISGGPGVVEHWGSPGVGATVASKAGDETLNNNNVLQNDDDLVLAVAANEVWVIDLVLLLEIRAASDFQSAWAIPAAGAIHTQDDRNWVRNDNANSRDGTVAAIIGPAALKTPLELMRFIYIGGANAGNVQFQWAQLNAIAEDTKVLAGSCLLATKVS